MKKNISKILLLLIIVTAFLCAKYFNLTHYLTLDFLKENKELLDDFYAQNSLRTIIIYSITYILATALSIPGALILTLAGGAIFGLVKGTIIISFASTIGATLSFAMARFLLRDFVQRKFNKTLKVINQGIERDGHFYLLTLRLIPAFPFFLINLAMGLTKIKMTTYFLISQAGMLLGTIVYVNAGVQLSKLDSVSGILNSKLILSFSLLAIFPLIAKKIITIYKTRRVYGPFKRPKSYDYNMITIGAGAGGLVTSYIGATVNAKVALIEQGKMGGDCLNTGCVPSKALIKSASVIHHAKRANDFGIKEIKVEFNFKDVMDRVKSIIKKIEPHDSIERYTQLGVDCITGKANIISPWEVEVNGRILTTRNITIATGARPFVPPIKGIELAHIRTSDNIWELEKLPKDLLILGGGPIGVELAQAFSRLGSKVTLVEMSQTLLSKEDSDVSIALQERLSKEGVNILTGHRAKEFKPMSLICEYQGQDVEVQFTDVLIAIGRKANTNGFGLKEIGVKLRKNGTIETNEFLQTNFPNIFACGDVAGPFQLTHTAAHQAWYCAVNGLFGRFKKFKVDYSVIPWATYTDPEVATVGKNEKMCIEEEIAYEITKYNIDDLDRAIADSEDYGFVKVLTIPGSDKILGATIIGNHASDLLLEFISAMKNNYGLNKILGTIHMYPTMGEANKYLAGAWKSERKPKKLLEFVRKYHSWQRK
ncbi:bifunctional TVP38/TMEM64 family protein/FAD-dependent oxidoreductase [Halobacteriovorax sp. JY17]|uniref:FAD-dependent oxidoreductase n=1 Tax=Halobacteriovorax sp. JY17 TaxID=2014617 RepID=UPI000C42F5D5|nr:bifunctional TVP38/TMEM64 family protein/FAD-dependent oxidoreductase [Halobacteriovorax sp. JY17]PIK14772.1 MAG: pyridine nucleotide-disulfide oxidoreductase [Halobacteriovorax sp. JY17]